MHGRLTLELEDAAGRRVATRRATNAVMRGGAELLARLFSGQGAPISHMGVGVNGAPEGEDYASEALTNEGDEALAGGTETPVTAESFTIAVQPERRVVTVSLRATLAREQAVGTLREAGLLARSEDAAVLYNRVTFAPLRKGDDHELTLHWEVSFPYGDLDAMF